VRSEADTEAVLREWASSAAPQELLPDVVEVFHESGPFAALAEMHDYITLLHPKYAPTTAVGDATSMF
jgi:hypothetical protein